MKPPKSTFKSTGLLFRAVGFAKFGKDGSKEFFLGGLGSFGFGFDRTFFGMLFVVAFPGTGFGGGLLGGGHGDDLHDDEEHDGDDDEGDASVDEGTPIDDRALVVGPNRTMLGIKSFEGVLPLH